MQTGKTEPGCFSSCIYYYEILKGGFFLAGNGLECQRSFFKAKLLVAPSQRGWIPMLLTPVSKIVEFQEVIFKDCFEMNPLTLQNQNFSL